MSSPVTDGLREGNGRITPKTQEISHFYDLPTWANHYGKWSRHLYDSSTWSNHRTRIKPGFFLYLTLSLSQALGQRLLCCPKRGTFVPPFLNAGVPRADDGYLIGTSVVCHRNLQKERIKGKVNVKFSLKPFSKGLQGLGRSLPVANALRRPNRQVRPTRTVKPHFAQKNATNHKGSPRRGLG